MARKSRIIRARFFAEVTVISAALVLTWTGLSHLPPTGPILNVVPGTHTWNPAYVALAVASAVAAWWLAKSALGRRLPLPPIPGVKAQVAGTVSALLAVPASLVLFWWLAAGAKRLPVGSVGWVLGIVALGSLTWMTVAASLIWLGYEAERERDMAELEPRAIGLD